LTSWAIVADSFASGRHAIEVRKLGYRVARENFGAVATPVLIEQPRDQSALQHNNCDDSQDLQHRSSITDAAWGIVEKQPACRKPAGIFTN